MDRRTIIATALIFLIYVVYFYFFAGTGTVPPEKREAGPPPQAQESEAIAPPKQVLKRPIKKFTPTDILGLDEQEVLVETDLLRVVLSNRGGRIKSWQLKKYIESNRSPVELVSYATLRSWVQEEKESERLYSVEGKGFRLESPGGKGTVVFTYIDPSGIQTKKSITLQNGQYLAEIRLEIINIGTTERTLIPILLWDSRVQETQEKRAYPLKEPTTWADDRKVADKLEKIEGKVIHRGSIAWTALNNKYFATALIPRGPEANALVMKNKEGQLSVGLAGKSRRLRPGEKSIEEFVLYAGPKEIERLKRAGSNLDRLVDLGWFDFLARPALYILKFLYKYTGNYGLAIIILTVLIKILFHPLTHKGFKAMKEMQVLQPKITALREKYKNNPQKMNQEIMELYKRHGVNPFGGCLPLVLQIPIFIALYNALSNAVELWRAPLIFWIQDLSAKDPYYVLPILMGISMLVQQWITPSTGDPRQAQLMYLMPFIFTFMFLNFPSGLVLYWLVNNLIGIGQQHWINKRMLPKRG